MIDVRILEIWTLGSTHSLPLLPDPLWLRVVVPARVISMSQVDLFENFSCSIVLCIKRRPQKKSTTQKMLIYMYIELYSLSWHVIKIKRSIKILEKFYIVLFWRIACMFLDGELNAFRQLKLWSKGSSTGLSTAIKGYNWVRMKYSLINTYIEQCTEMLTEAESLI